MLLFLHLRAALHDITQPTVADENRQLGLVDPPNSTKEIFVFCFLAWRGVPGVTHNTFFFDSLMLGGFSSGRFLRKELFSSFHLSCLPLFF